MEYEITDCILDDIGGYKNIIYVDKDSPKSALDALAQYARYFRWEMHFDGLQFDKNMYSREDYVGFLILKKAVDCCEHIEHYPSRVVGAGVFRKYPEGMYELDWVWVHPFVRRKRILLNCWGGFKDKFGDFYISSPWSDQMTNLVEKHHIEKKD